MDFSYFKSVIKSIILQKPLFFFIPATLVLLLFGLSLGFIYKQSSQKEEIKFEEIGGESASPSVQSVQKIISPIKVEITGAVVQPGVYEMEVGNRIGDLVNKAGGFSQEVDLNWVAKNLNQAEKLNDGEKIYIPTSEEIKQSQTANADRGVVGSSSGVDTKPKESLICSNQININTANQEELDRCLPGIGPTYAQRIIEYRNQYGGFKNIEEIMNISGIGEKTFEKIKDKITIY